jgi:hypothetical protein
MRDLAVSRGLRYLGAGALILAATLLAAVGYFTVVYAGSSGCEDFQVACRHARPWEAALLGVLAAGAVLGLLVAAAGLVRARSHRAVLAPLMITACLIAAALALLALD